MSAAVGSNPEIVANQVSYDSPIGSPRPVVSRIDEVADVTVAADRVTIRTALGVGSSILVYVVVPPRTDVTFKNNGAVITRATPQPSVTVQDGHIVPLEVQGRQSLLTQLSIGGMRAPVSDVQRLPDGTFAATLYGLKSHLVSWSEPPGAASLTSANLRHPSSLELRIDEKGAVVMVIARNGAEDVLKEYESTIRAWRFTPFLNGSTPVAVKATIPFFVATDGRVRCPLHPTVSVRGPAANAVCCQQ